MIINRKRKIIVIVALVVSIIGMSLGFAAFSTTLSISSSASVTPNSSDFNVEFLENVVSTYVVTHPGGVGGIEPIVSGGANGSIIEVGGTSISGLKANFTAPGQTVTYDFYVANTGNYDAYLRSVEFGNVSCIPGTDATSGMVEDACGSISIKLEIDEDLYTETNTLITNKILYKDTYLPVRVTLSYDIGGARADGAFDVEFGNIELEYSTVDYQKKIITFTINNDTYQAEEGMTLGEWANSDYNNSSYVDYTNESEVCYRQKSFSSSLILEDGSVLTSIGPCAFC